MGAALATAIATSIAGPVATSGVEQHGIVGNAPAFNPHAAAMASFAGGVQGFATHTTDVTKLFRDVGRTQAVAVAGEAVAALQDLSGNGNHATQATGSLQADWQGSLRFVGSDDSYATPAFTMASGKATLVIKLAPEANASNGIPVELSAISGSNPGSFVLFAPNTSTNQYSMDMRGTSATVNRTMPGNVAPLTSTIIVDMDLTAATVASQLGIEIVPLNGTTSTGGPTAPGTTFGHYQLFIGRRGGTTLPFKGKIIALAVIGKQLSAGEKTIWRDWANGNYAPAQHGAITNKVVVVKRDNDIYIRTVWTTGPGGTDLVQRVAMLNGVSTVPEMVNPMGARLIPNSEIDVKGAYDVATAANNVAAQSDDATPFQYGGTFIGANHGHDRHKRITMAAHGKTVEDIGSVWTDSGARRFVLMRIVDANLLEFISENQSVYPVWSFHSTLSGTTLTHASGALNTGTITFGAPVAFQLYPATNNHVRAVKIDGGSDIYAGANGIYIGNFVDVQHDYRVMNPAAIVTVAKNRVGGATAPNYNDNAIAADLQANIVYSFNPWHGCRVDHTATPINTISLNYVGFTQAVKLTASGTDLYWAFIPRLSSFMIGGNTYNFSAQKQMTSWPDAINITASMLADVSKPPTSMTHLIKNSGGTKLLSFTQGYLADRGAGVPATRLTLTNEFCKIASGTGKHYMVALNGSGSAFPGSVWNIGVTYGVTAYRSFTNHVQDFPHGPEFSITRDGNEFVVIMDFDTTLSNQLITLPTPLNGMTATVIANETTGSVTLHSPTVTGGGLTVSVSGGLGRLAVRLS